jgi:hypothetical protein
MDKPLRIRTLIPATLTGALVAATILAAFDRDWIGTVVLAVIAGVVALRVRRRIADQG